MRMYYMVIKSYISLLRLLCKLLGIVTIVEDNRRTISLFDLHIWRKIAIYISIKYSKKFLKFIILSSKRNLFVKDSKYSRDETSSISFCLLIFEY